MHVREPGTRRRGVAVLLAVAAGLVLAVVDAPSASAAPWGTSGSEYDGVLCRLDGTTVPMGAWTVNGASSAYALRDITGTGVGDAPAPYFGAATAMAPGQDGLSGADIAAVAYLIDHDAGRSAAARAEISATVAELAGDGRQQAACLGQQGTSAADASALLDRARRRAGPYVVSVDVPGVAVPGRDAVVTVTVRSASGEGVPGLPVELDDASGTGVSASGTTDDGGVTRLPVVVPRVAAVALTARVRAPAGLTRFATDPPSVGAAPLETFSGSAVLRPDLHPDPTVTLDAPALVLAGTTASPSVRLAGTLGYSGNGAVVLRGPVAPVAGSCAHVTDAALAASAVVWQDAFTFRGDGRQDVGPSPDLAAGCYRTEASATTTDSVPAVTRRAAPARTTVSGLSLGVTAVDAVALPGDLRASATVTSAAGARVTGTVAALGPLPLNDGTCTGRDWDAAPIAGRSAGLALDAARPRADVTVPGAGSPGCYAFVADVTVRQDGLELTTTSRPTTTGRVTAVVRPTVSVSAAAPSGPLDAGMPGHVVVGGVPGFAGRASIGLVRAEDVPITGCADARFPSSAVPVTEAETVVGTRGTGSFAFRTTAPGHGACWGLVARLTLDANPRVAVSTPAPAGNAVFLAGVRPAPPHRADVGRTTNGLGLRMLLVYALGVVLVLACGVLVLVRTTRGAVAAGLARPSIRSVARRARRLVSPAGLRRVVGRGPDPTGTPRPF